MATVSGVKAVPCVRAINPSHKPKFMVLDPYQSRIFFNMQYFPEAFRTLGSNIHEKASG